MIFKSCLLLILSLAVVPLMQAIWLRSFNPRLTLPMRNRLLHYKRTGKAGGHVKFNWVSLEEVPPVLLRCFCAAEDPKFFMHHGFDFDSIRLAIREARRSRKRPRGASTITMQCARSVFLWHKRSWFRKGLEAYYTICIEMTLSKRRIMEVYANVIEFGEGIYGVQAACLHHFGVPVGQLDECQSIRLVWLLPSPRKRVPRMLKVASPRFKQIALLSKNVELPWQAGRRKVLDVTRNVL